MLLEDFLENEHRDKLLLQSSARLPIRKPIKRFLYIFDMLNFVNEEVPVPYGTGRAFLQHFSYMFLEPSLSLLTFFQRSYFILTLVRLKINRSGSLNGLMSSLGTYKELPLEIPMFESQPSILRWKSQR